MGLISPELGVFNQQNNVFDNVFKLEYNFDCSRHTTPHIVQNL